MPTQKLGGRCGTEGERMPVFDAFQGHTAPEIKVTVTGRSISTDLVVIPAGAKCSGEETIQNHLEQLYGE
jgi:hypothetical protein